MNTSIRGFGSDNHSGIHPQILAALTEADSEHAPSYGTDRWTESLRVLIKNQFGESAEPHIVFNGTAANVLCLSALLESHQSILTSSVSHLHVDECGAPEKWIGCKVIPVACENGKLTPDLLLSHVIRKGDQHFSQVKAISITQPTEYGTLYSYEELQALGQFAKDHDLYFHVDGARFIYAAQALDRDFKSLTQDLGIHALSFGGTKNGLLFGELCIFFGNVARDFKYIRKQAMQLPSKQRFIAKQFLRLLDAPYVWKDIARHGMALARHLAGQIQDIPEVKITRPVQANSVFVCIPKDWIKSLRRQFFFYVWDEATFECRLMLSFDNTKDDVDQFVNALHQLRKSK